MRLWLPEKRTVMVLSAWVTKGHAAEEEEEELGDNEEAAAAAALAMVSDG